MKVGSMSMSAGTRGKCPICKNSFTRGYKGQVTCSRKCGAYWRAQKKRNENGVPKAAENVRRKNTHCQWCGGTLGVGRMKYCCEDCCKAAEKQRVKDRIATMPDKACEQCGKLFKLAYPTKRFCSKECMGMHNLGKSQNRKAAETQMKREPVKLLVVRPVPVRVEMMPTVGKIYEGLACWGKNCVTYVIPEIGKYGLVVRENEVRVVG